MAPLAGRRNVFGLAALALAALPALANPYILYVTNIALIYVILAVGLNLLLGYAGQFAFANAALFGIGAYATGLLQVKLGLSFWVAFPAAVLFTTLVGVVIALPALANPYILYVTNIALIYVILAVGLNLLLGYAGQFAFANAALFGIGAYATGLLQVKLGLSFWIAFPVAVLFTTLVGVVVALPALRLSGLYLALVTLAFAQFTQWLMLNWERVTFGAGGFRVPALTFGPVAPALGLYYVTLLLAGLLIAVAWNTVRSGIGRALVAVRDSEVAAEALAVDLARYKTIAFSLSALYAGVAGGLYSAILSFVAPEGFDLFQMVVQFSMVVVGGLGSVWGSVLGAGLLVGLQEALRAFKSAQEIAFGLLLMACIIFLPDGLISLVKRRVPGWEEPLRAPDRQA